MQKNTKDETKDKNKFEFVEEGHKYFLNGKCGLREKLQCELMRFLRNNLSPIMPIKLRNFCKKIMHKVF